MPTLWGVKSIGNQLHVLADLWVLRLFLGLLANNLVWPSVPHKLSILLPLVVAHSWCGSHTC
jgi:hypothetical protein